ncbi:MAG: hypothetical protein ABJO67_03275 [Pseudoruegeria sp.]
MKKPGGMSVEKYNAFLLGLADKLSYLTDLHLDGVREYTMRIAKGPDRNRWPDEVSILNWARDRQLPPPRKYVFSVSVLRSRAGERARQLGYHAELLIALRKLGPPFTKYDVSRMPDEARLNAEEVVRVATAIKAGRATVERRQWLDWYQRHGAEALAIMDAAADEFEICSLVGTGK